MSDSTKYDVRKLVDFQGYFDRFYHHLQKSGTYKQAYDLVEEEYRTAYGRNRYSSYESFRVIKNRRIHNLKNNI